MVTSRTHYWGSMQNAHTVFLLTVVSLGIIFASVGRGCTPSKRPAPVPPGPIALATGADGTAADCDSAINELTRRPTN